MLQVLAMLQVLTTLQAPSSSSFWKLEEVLWQLLGTYGTKQIPQVQENHEYTSNTSTGGARGSPVLVVPTGTHWYPLV